MEKKGYDYDYKFDWIVRKNKIENDISNPSDIKTAATKTKDKEKNKQRVKGTKSRGNKSKSKQRK
jgi:hypothetical protein